MADAETPRKRRGTPQGSDGNGQAGPAATGTEEVGAAPGEGLDGGQPVTTETTEPVAATETPQAGQTTTGAAEVGTITWDTLNVRLLEIEQQHPDRRIVRVFAPCDEVPEMFIGAFGSAPVEFAEIGKPPTVQWHDGEIVEL